MLPEESCSDQIPGLEQDGLSSGTRLEASRPLANCSIAGQEINVNFNRASSATRVVSVEGHTQPHNVGERPLLPGLGTQDKNLPLEDESEH